MNKKLTLTIEEETIKKAKSYASKKNRSLSDIIENYLKSLVIEKDNTQIKELNSVVNSLKGSFKLPANFDYKKELAKRLEKKYL